jgi:hypothetical protein
VEESAEERFCEGGIFALLWGLLEFPAFLKEDLLCFNGDLIGAGGMREGF